MRRREFITLLGGVAAWPFPGQAQQPTMPMVGYLDFYAAEPTGIFLTAFRNGRADPVQEGLVASFNRVARRSSTTSTLPLAASKNGDAEFSVRGNDSEHAIGGRGLISIRSERATRVLPAPPIPLTVRGGLR